ncbi:MAG: hypothetical protein J0M12_14125 [Deltaproteobacteria bacterium]|nr:hypothetical protein [Deltaproteobacteria bacterium]
MRTLRLILLFALPLSIMATCSPAAAEDSDEGDVETAASPKSAWGDFKVGTPPEDEHTPVWKQIVLWVPNRVLDFIDIFRVDVGAGAAVGAVVRVTKYGQVGMRAVAPLSVRVGDFGRRAPILLEHSSEMGIGPLYLESKDRKICTFELGAGVDIFVGAYGGVCVDEIVDFAGGLFFLDMKKDDLK